MSVAEASKTKINNESAPSAPGPRCPDLPAVRGRGHHARPRHRCRHRATVPDRRLRHQAGARPDRANPDRQFTFALLGFISLRHVIPAFLAAARLCRRRRPVLTTVALAVNLVGFIGAFALFAIDNLYLIGASLPAEQRDVAAIVIDEMWSTGIPGFSTNLFVLGHILGTILMGLALRGSIPTVGWLAMLLTTPVHFLAFVVLQMPALDMAAWLLMTLAFVYCAVKIVKTPNDEWDLPPIGKTASNG